MRRKFFAFTLLTCMLAITQTNAQLTLNQYGGTILGQSWDPTSSIGDYKLRVYGNTHFQDDLRVDDDLTVFGTLNSDLITNTQIQTSNIISNGTITVSSPTNFTSNININANTTLSNGKIRINGPGSQEYIDLNTTNPVFIKNEKQVSLLSSYTLKVGGESFATNLHVTGKAVSGGWVTSSDRRLKKNIRNIENPGELLMKIEGKIYNYKNTNELKNILVTYVMMHYLLAKTTA